MLDWFKNNKRFIKIRAIEQELNMPDSTLIKAVSGVQNLPKKWQEPLNKFLTGLIKSEAGRQNIKTD
jgi:hypothetical protein